MTDKNKNQFWNAVVAVMSTVIAGGTLWIGSQLVEIKGELIGLRTWREQVSAVVADHELRLRDGKL